MGAAAGQPFQSTGQSRQRLPPQDVHGGSGTGSATVPRRSRRGPGHEPDPGLLWPQPGRPRITAAAWSLKGEDWPLDTHGIRSKGFHLRFPDIEIRTDPPGTQGSFAKVSEVLDSPVWEKDPLRLEDISDLLPTNLHYPLTTRDRLTPLYTDEGSIDVGDHSLLSVFVCNIPDRVAKGRHS